MEEQLIQSGYFDDAHKAGDFADAVMFFEMHKHLSKAELQTRIHETEEEIRALEHNSGHGEEFFARVRHFELLRELMEQL